MGDDLKEKSVINHRKMEKSLLGKCDFVQSGSHFS